LANCWGVGISKSDICKRQALTRIKERAAVQRSRAIIWHGFQAITTGFLFPILMPVTLTYSRSYLMFDPRLQLGDGGFQGAMGWPAHKQQIMDAVLRNAKVQE